jgi:hypothetical protein
MVSNVPSRISLGRQLCNPGLELGLLGTDRLDLNSIDLSILSVEALDDILAGASFSIDGEDRLLDRLLSLGDEYRPLLRWIEIRFLSATGLAALTEDLESPPECLWLGIRDRLIPPPAPPPSGWDSAIVPDFPVIFKEFREKKFTLLWRGSRDGFGGCAFHRRCDGHANTLTVILDTDGNIFGGFTPVAWKSGDWHSKADPSLKSFLFTLMNPHNFPARRFALKAEKKDQAIYCNSWDGPRFGGGMMGGADICVRDNCNAKTNSATSLGNGYTNDTGVDGETFFTGSYQFQVKEIEVFEITA